MSKIGGIVIEDFRRYGLVLYDHLFFDERQYPNP